MKITDRALAYEQASSQKNRDFWAPFFDGELEWSTDLRQEYLGVDAICKGKALQLKLRETYYPDILIEFANGDAEKGWINKSNQKCDFLVMGWRPCDQICIMDWNSLREAWNNNHFNWFTTLGNRAIKMGKNEINGKRQVTLNLAVPFNMLREAGVKLNIRKHVNG